MVLMTSTAVDTASSPSAEPPAWRQELLPWVKLLATFLLLLLFSWLGIDLSRHSEGVATIWFTNGLLFAIIIRKPQKLWLYYFAIGLLADILADVIYGDRLGIATGVSIANSVEVIAATLLLTHLFGSPFTLSRRKPLIGFLGIAVVGGPVVSSLLGTAVLMFYGTPGPWWQVARTWYLGDFLGMAIIAPLAFILQRPGFFAVLQRKELARTLLVLCIPALATILVFSQNSYPLIFAIFPALLIVVFQRGFPGTVLAIVVIALIAITLTVNGHGPLMLLAGSTILLKIVVLQVFLATALVTAFPVAALLEERKSLELSLQQSEAQYRELANTDALTGVRNRRAFDERLNAEWYRPEAMQAPLSLLSIDVDYFKAYNDIYGHIAGDDCLRRLASTMTESLGHITAREQLYRMGGEEFSVLLPDIGQDQALSIAERLRCAVSDARIEHSGSPFGIQTISVGVVTGKPLPESSTLTLLALSDRALYRAKDLGRNRSELVH